MKIPWRRERYPLQYSDLENSMDCIVHGVRKSQTRLGNFHFQKFILWSQSLVAEKVKNLSAMKETWVRSLSQEDSLEKGNGNPLQYSGLENRMDRGAWQDTVHGVAKTRPRLGTHISTHTRLCQHIYPPVFFHQSTFTLGFLFFSSYVESCSKVIITFNPHHYTK